jgi:type I restriction enzyme S subunit
LVVNISSLDEQKVIVTKIHRVRKIARDRSAQLGMLDNLIKSRFVEMFGDPVSNPIGFPILTLGDICTGLRYGTSQPPKFSEDGYMFIRATNIKQGAIVMNDMKFINEDEASKLDKCKMSGGEMIIVRSGVNAGDTCIVTDDYIGHYAGYDIIIEFDTEKINPVFINTMFNIPEYITHIIKPLTRRAAQPHLNAEQVKSFRIILPSLEEQNKYADFVQQVDKLKVEVLKSLAETQKVFDSLMQTYFK